MLLLLQLLVLFIFANHIEHLIHQLCSLILAQVIQLSLILLCSRLDHCVRNDAIGSTVALALLALSRWRQALALIGLRDRCLIPAGLLLLRWRHAPLHASLPFQHVLRKVLTRLGARHYDLSGIARTADAHAGELVELLHFVFSRRDDVAVQVDLWW